MTNQRIIFILGLWVAILPFLGFPNNWKKIFFLVAGGTIAYLSYLLYKEKKNVVAAKEKRANTYTDNRGDIASQ